MLRRLTLVAMALATVFSAGCANGRFYNPFRPNDVQAQRIRATVHDPYPDQDKGPPVDDARPRDYQRQMPEPRRSQLYTDGNLGR